MALSIGIDIGGTFTDVVALETTTGKITVKKIASTPGNLAKGFWEGTDKIVQLAGEPLSDVVRLIHGTTVATNAILERTGAKVGILTTEGFEAVLILGRAGRSEMYSVMYDAETPTFLCPLSRIMGIKERIDANGNVLIPLDDANVIEAVDYLVKKHGVQAIAVCYILSFINPEHEQRTEQIIRERYPNVRVSASYTINPRFREYERTVITTFDAYIGPVMEAYISSLEDGMSERGIGVKLQVMQSRGGITSAKICVERPVITLLSGPAGGVAGATFIGRVCGEQNVISLDMGGTSNDVALISKGAPFLSIEGKIGKYPLRQAMVEITTVGAGGGSIAWLDPAGGLKVGPQSAGADPGPACYGWGGEKPTVTDASVVLGYLNPEYFAGGEVRLQPERAVEAVREHIASKLNMSVVQAASGIHKVINSSMADQLRLVSVYKGYHPQDFSLVAFGGAGPVAAGRLMEQLSLKKVIIPPRPGVLSGFGLLVAKIEHEEVEALVVRADEVDPEDIMRAFRQLENICEQKREGVGISLTQLHIQRLAEMRYVGQSYELEVPFPEGKGKLTKDIIQTIVQRFHSVHQSTYQHSSPDNPVEFAALRVVYWQEPRPMVTLQQYSASSSAEVIPYCRRKVYFDEYNDYVDTAIYNRADITWGQKLIGPAIVEQSDTTTVIYPTQVAEADKWGNLLITTKGGE